MRHSVEKADWSFEREGDYQSLAHDVASRAGVLLRQHEDDIYLADSESEELFVRASQPKRLWYETWLALQERFGHPR